MNRKKVAICIGDKNYEERFVKCMMNHYRQQYEIHVLSSLSEIKNMQERMYEAIIIGDEEETFTTSLVECGYQVLVLKELSFAEQQGVESEYLAYIEKYQEVYKIIEILRRSMESNLQKEAACSGKYKLVGISSLNCEYLQLPFAALTSTVYGEKSSVLLVDLQPYSCVEGEVLNEEDVLGMEDLLSIAATGVYAKSRLLGGIGQEQKWDFIRPVKNTECLAEADGDMYRKMLDIVAAEQGYDVVVLNFGAVFTGMFDLMNLCDEFYWLEEKGKGAKWREQRFFEEMKRRGADNFLQKVLYLELPTTQIREKEWKSVMQQWLWSDVGNQLREHIWAEKNCG